MLTKIKQKLVDLLCSLGLHSTETKTYQAIALDQLGTKHDLRYAVCKHCGAGDPLVTGEW